MDATRKMRANMGYRERKQGTKVRASSCLVSVCFLIKWRDASLSPLSSLTLSVTSSMIAAAVTAGNKMRRREQREETWRVSKASCWIWGTLACIRVMMKARGKRSERPHHQHHREYTRLRGVQTHTHTQAAAAAREENKREEKTQQNTPRH